jgi:hypothetical protein
MTETRKIAQSQRHLGGVLSRAELIGALTLALMGPQARANTIDLPVPECTVEVREDGCSVPDDLEFFVTDYYNDVFKRSCRMHDRCYATKGMSQASCDNKFRTSMQDRCNDVFDNTDDDDFWDFVNPLNIPSYLEGWVSEGTCKLVADTYYLAVAEAGQGSYNGGQNWADGHCEGNDRWRQVTADDLDHTVQCPDDQFITGYYRINAGPFVQWHCSSIPGVSYSSTTNWKKDSDGSHKFTCADGKALVAAKKRQGHARHSYKCAAVNRSGNGSWSDEVNSRTGRTFYCDDYRDGSIMVGVDYDQDGHVNFKCAKPMD